MAPKMMTGEVRKGFKINTRITLCYSNMIAAGLVGHSMTAKRTSLMEIVHCGRAQAFRNSANEEIEKSSNKILGPFFIS